MDAFVLAGHSTGERYFRGSELAQISRCAVTMLMGCSSGKLRCVGDYGVEGMPLSYMLAGCPGTPLGVFALRLLRWNNM